MDVEINYKSSRVLALCMVVYKNALGCCPSTTGRVAESVRRDHREKKGQGRAESERMEHGVAA
jgi:hypothetical protein